MTPKVWRQEVQRRRTSVTFETLPLKECVDVTKFFDQHCFPEEMWLGTEAIEKLIEGGAESTVLSVDGSVIGQAITLREQEVECELRTSDELFSAKDCGIYSYSEAIIPAYQNRGYGGLLLYEIAVRMKLRGFTTISAHVRRKHGWAKKRRLILPVSEERHLLNFWEDESETVAFQRATL